MSNSNSQCTCTCTCTCICTPNNNNNSYGNLVIHHTGAYMARFHISWDVLTQKNNTMYIETKDWVNNGHYFTAPYSTTIPIPMDAFNISIKAEGNTGLVWQLWNTIVYKTSLPMVQLRTVNLWGTSLAQHGSIDPDSGGSGNVLIEHHGAYLARFFITWEEISVAGNTIINSQRSWEHNGQYFSAPYYTTIPIPMTAKNLSIKAEDYTGLAPGGWITIIDVSGLSMVPTRTVKLWGTNSVPHGSVDPP